jgi:protein-S-isoprenylcysteine O-methyltransferase Ste14
MILLAISVLLWGTLHSLLASLKCKNWVSQVFGAGVNRVYRLAYNVIASLSFMAVLAVAILTPDRRLYLVRFPWSGLMVVGEILAVAVLVIAFQQKDKGEFLGLRRTARLSEKPQGKLVIDGLYRHVRHPLYSAGLVFIWLLPLMTVNVLTINITLTVYVIVGAYFEERKLVHEFGQDYADYQATTPMFIPSFRGNKSHPKT